MNQTRTAVDLGKGKISKLLVKQSVPAAVGFLVLVIYQVADTIFVGRGVGTLAIAGITVVMPISMLIASIGMSLGIGGASVISRALGAKQEARAHHTFGNLITLTLILSVATVLLGSFFLEETLVIFGAKGDILPFAIDYFTYILPGVPFLAFAMMSNNVIRAEGNARVAMFTMIVPAVVNIILDPIFIFGFKWGIKGAAIATSFAYICSASYSLWYFLKGNTSMKIQSDYFVLKWILVSEIFAIGMTSMARQGSMSLLALVLNHTLYHYGQEIAVAVYGVLNRVMLFSFFPLIGLLHGFLPITGYNYGGGRFGRVKRTLKLSIISGTLISTFIFIVIMAFASPIVSIFSNDPELINMTTPALRIIFFATPIVAVQMLGAGYFQAIGKALPALLLTLTRQGIFLIPLVLIFPMFWGLDGVWLAFPIAEVLAAITTFFFLLPQWKKLTLAESDALLQKEDSVLPVREAPELLVKNIE